MLIIIQAEFSEPFNSFYIKPFPSKIVIRLKLTIHLRLTGSVDGDKRVN